jgi:hypothetical protein
LRECPSPILGKKRGQYVYLCGKLQQLQNKYLAEFQPEKNGGWEDGRIE